MQEAKRLAKEYYRVTGRPLGITGEVAEYEAIRLLNLKISPVRQEGYDAIRMIEDRTERIQIKGRAAQVGRVGNIKIDKEWDSVVLVLLNEDFEPTQIFEAVRADIHRELIKPGSKARNERGSLSISKFKEISEPIWPQQNQSRANFENPFQRGDWITTLP